jgi:hypothetical protein
VSDRRTTAMTDAATIRAIHEWPHWVLKTHFERRVLAAQVVWTVKLDGPLDGENVTDTLLNLLAQRGVVFPPETKRYALATITGILAKQVTSTKGVLVDHALLARTVVGQRTKHLSVLEGVELPPNPFPPEPVEVEPAPPAVVAEPVAAMPEVEKPSSNGHRPEPVIVKTPTDKAMLILRLAGELALDLAAMPAADDGEESGRLAEALAEAQRLRHRLTEVEEQVASQRRVLDALKVQRDILQSNLDAAMKGERRPDESGRRALDRMMREPVRER